MGVSHLRSHANAAKGASAPTGGSPKATQVSTPLSTRFAAGSGANNVPMAGGVKSHSNQALKPGTSPAQPNKEGARAGSKAGQPHIGSHDGTAHPMSGGRAG